MQKIFIDTSFPNPDELRLFIKQLPTVFNSSGTILFDNRNTIKKFDLAGKCINVKFFGKPNLFNAFIYRFFRKSKAERSYENALLLKQNGILTPQPFACMLQSKYGLFSKSCYISEQEIFDGNLYELRTGSLEKHRKLISDFAQFTAELHSKNILHLDYSPGNILYKMNPASGEYSFYLVDLNRMRFYRKITLSEACKSFRRLVGSEEMIRYFSSKYAESRQKDDEKCIEMTLNYRDKFWKKFEKRHKNFIPNYLPNE